MIMQLAGDADAGPLTIDRDDPDDYKDNYSGGVSPPPSPPPAASPAPSMAPGHGSSSPGLGGLAGLHHALHGLHNLHNLHNLQNFHNLQQNLQTQMAALAGLQGGLGVPSVSSLLHPHLAAAAAQQHPGERERHQDIKNCCDECRIPSQQAATAAAAAAAAAPPPTNINTGNNGAGNSNNNAANVPQMVLTSGHVTQGVQGAQLLVPTSQGIAVQPILTIPLGQPGVGSSSLMNPLVPLHHLHQPSPHHQHTDQQQQQQQQHQQQQQQQHHHHHHHHVTRSGGPSQVCEANDANEVSSEHNESKSFPFRLPWRTLSSAASSPLPPSTSSNSSSSSSCSSTSAAPHPLLGLAGLPPSLFHHAHNNNNNNNSNNNNNNNNMGSPDSKPKLPLPLSSPVTDAIGSLGARMGGHYPGPPPPPPTARYSPDFLDNHNQPTISQSTGNLVDGVNLDEIKEFAKAFKIRRLSMGLTQTQVGQALSITEGPAYSQSAICRFEKLDITPKSAQKIKPVLERWMQEAEDRYKNGQHTLTEFMGSEPSKKRKRRTSFTPQALEVLNSHFERNTHPSGAEITALAEQLGYEREVVRIWFCNKRQALKNTVRMMAKTNPNQQPPPPPPPQHPTINPPTHPSLNPSPHPTMN